jgi:hypothetical protein
VKHHKPQQKINAQLTSAEPSTDRTNASTADVVRSIAKPAREAWWAPLVTVSFALTALSIAAGIVGAVVAVNTLSDNDGKSDKAVARVVRR